MKTTDIHVGDVIGRWTILGGPRREKRTTPGSVNYITLFDCRCTCGTERPVRVAKLVRNSQSCGCLKKEQFRTRTTRHGHARGGGKSPLYAAWDGMIQRCTNPGHESFHRYGGAGVTICPQWRDFSVFAAWAVANGHAPGLEIDRVDSTGNYEPSNCRWATEAVQQRNKRTTQWVTAFGETKCLTDWALDARCAVAPQTIGRRIDVLGWSPEKAIVTPRASRKQAARFPGNHVKKRQI